MRLHPRVLFAATLTLLSACASTKPASDPGAAALAMYREAMTKAVQGDLREALPRMRQIDLNALDASRRRTVEDILARFGDGNAPAPALDPWTADVLAAYRSYWTRVMLGRVTANAGEQELAQALSRLAGSEGARMDALEPLLQKRIEANGLHSLFGVTAPLREFMLWRVQNEQRYTVQLPEGSEQVQVAMLDQFISFGWVGWATAERAHTGGWTTSERLYCVKSAYDLNSEAFHVSYLAHEGQHFADARQFPSLEQPELEYRAKLVEISLADKSLESLLDEFVGNQSDSRDQPHPYANRRLMHDLRATVAPAAGDTTPWWRTADPAQLHKAAVRLLREDSAKLRSRSASQ